MSLFLEALGFGVASGAVIALGAVGFTVQFGISNVFNVAYGSFLSLGAYLGYALNVAHVNLWLSMVIAAVAIGLASVTFNRLLVAPLQRRGSGFISSLIATVQAGLVVLYAIIIIAGPTVRTYQMSNGGLHSIAGLKLTTTQLIVIAMVAVVMFAYHVLLTHTQLGKAMRATSVNPVVARSCGMRVSRIIDAAWFVSGLLCGMSGVVIAATTTAFNPTVGITFFVYMTAAAVLGGVGWPYGAMIGGLIIGISTQLVGAFSTPAYEAVAAFAILVIVILMRPAGLLGSSAPRRVAD